MQVGFTFCRYFLALYLLFLPLWLSSEAVRTFQYDKNNQLVKEHKANGYAISYEYDACGHLVKEAASDETVVEYVYDENGNCTQMTDSHGTTTYFYDPLNQLIAVEFPDTNPFSYQYDARGRLIGMDYPNDWHITYEYDSSDRLVAVTDGSGTTRYEYDNPSNTLVRVTLPNGMITEYRYDRARRITDVIHKRSNGMIITSYHYLFDANGNRIQIDETGQSGTKCTRCTYDKLNRLLSAACGEWYEKFTYDSLGNRLSRETPDGVIEYAYDQNNHLFKAGDTSFHYDPYGNLIKKVSPQETVEFVYDAHDNLIEFRSSKHVAKYGYDGAGRRISKNVDGVITNYINDVHSPVWHVALEATDAYRVSSLYTYGLSRINAVLPTASYFYLYEYPDRSVVALVDSGEHVVNEYQYTSFGSFQRKVAGISNDFAYAGEAYEEESGLIYLRNRYYDPELGRFISPDPDFGSKTNPQSLNPYTYVNNNPLNYIDPLGLRSAKACAYVAGTKTKKGRSSVGHAFWQLTHDDGTVTTIGRYPFRIRYDDEIVPGTETYEWPATDDQIEQIIESVHKGPYLLAYNNCVDGLERGLDILNVEHPSLSSFGISTPPKAVFWLESLNGRSDQYDAYTREARFAADPDSYMAMQANKPEPPQATRPSGNVGGVSLNKTAKLFGEISDIAGVTYDAATGQLIIIGKKQSLGLPKMEFDDLAVAVRSIYGLGGKPPQNPGVSLEPDPDHPNDYWKTTLQVEKPHPLLVRYMGQTKNTRFGWVMFEADRILKCLSLGKDNINGQELHTGVKGFKNLPKRYATERQADEELQIRLWFVPKEMALYKNPKGDAIVFKEAKMEVLTETNLSKKKKTTNTQAEKFAAHFTENYGQIAERYPVLKELERLGKITAIVKWMKENNIPLDLSLFENYKPIHHDTPKTTPAISAIIKHKNATYPTTIIGGVMYYLDESNFHEIVNEHMNPISAAALHSRPSENAFSWSFRSPGDTSEYEAVAQTIERTVKAGSIRKRCVDMHFSLSHNCSLELVRHYNSFSDADIGFGRGWDIVCTRLRFPRQKVLVTWKEEPNPIAVYPEIFAEVEGHESRYALVGLRADRRPLYESLEEQAFLVETDQGYILSRFGGKLLAFAFDGKVMSKGRYNQEQVRYHYDEKNRVIAIQHTSGSKIQLTYDNDRIVRVSGPGEKWIQYRYDAQGQLQHVEDSLGTVESYGYDADKNLNTIRNCRGDLLFDAVYDEYHRAIAQTVHGKKQTNNFDLQAHTVHSEHAGQGAFFSRYDSSYRLLEASDAENRSVKITYEEGQTRPKSISDCLGNEKQYAYDGQGNIIRIVDALGTVQRFWYNQDDQLAVHLDGRKKAELYFYNELGLLTRIYHFAELVSDDIEHGQVSFTPFPKYVTEYGYDSDSGLLLWIKRGEDIVKSFSYNQDGMLVAVTIPTGYTLHRSYDTRGRLSKVWDSADSGFDYHYDDRDRLIRVSSPDSAIEYRYDDMENQSAVKDACGGITGYSFDAFGNLLKIRDPLGGETSFEYDGSHNLKRLILPNGSMHEIEYDGAGRPITTSLAA